MGGRDNIIKHLDDIGQSLDPCTFFGQGVLEALVLGNHSAKLGGNLCGEFYAGVATGGFIVEGLALDLIEQIDTTLEEFGVREFPGLVILRGALGAWRLLTWDKHGVTADSRTDLVDLVKTVHVELTDKAGELVQG